MKTKIKRDQGRPKPKEALPALGLPLTASRKDLNRC